MTSPVAASLPLLVAMAGAFLLLGWLGARRARQSDLILGGRALPVWLAVLTMTATWVDRETFPGRGGLAPPISPSGATWTAPSITAWWDLSVMLLLGGIPWNCYFQRVLACATPSHARRTSIVAGLATMVLVVPPLVLGVAAAVFPWSGDAAAQLAQTPAQALPLLLREATPPFVALLGLGAIVGAVTSSFSASVLSAASMATWNGVRALVGDRLREPMTTWSVRGGVLTIGTLAAVPAWRTRARGVARHRLSSWA